MRESEAAQRVRIFGDPRFRKAVHASIAHTTGSAEPELFEGWQSLSEEQHAETLRRLTAFFYLRARVNRKRRAREGVETAIRSAGQVVLLRDGEEGIEVFLGKRLVGGFEKQWGSQGGGVDRGETVEAATVRETKEEAGVDIAEEDLVFLSRYVSHFARRKGGRLCNTEYRVSVFAARANGLEPYNASEHEHESMGWKTVSRALLMHESAATQVPGKRNDYAEDTLTPSVVRILRRLKHYRTVEEALSAIGAPARVKSAETPGIAR